MLKTLTVATFIAALSFPALAEDTIVKEHHDDGAGVAVKIPVPSVEVRDHDCSSTTIHKENDEGDSKTVRKTDCN